VENTSYTHTSFEKVPVCRSCLEERVQENYNLFYTTRVVGTQYDEEWPDGCVICEKSKLCAMVPKNLVDDWLEGRLFHTQWKEENVR